MTDRLIQTKDSVTLKALLVLLLTVMAVRSGRAQTVDLKQEYGRTLLQLVDALWQRQVKDADSPDQGAIRCIHCGILHTRAAEAVFPFTIAYEITGATKYKEAARHTAHWLLQQQEPNGSWKETPEEWTGTTTDQLLMLLLSYERLQKELTPVEKKEWEQGMRRAADYLQRVMRPEFASINYVATTTATLAAAARVLKDTAYRSTAQQLAHRTISKMDADGFLNGEGGRSHGNKMGVDLGYDMEMSLWGLGLYAKWTGDTAVYQRVNRALGNHLYFIYPDGSMDNSWGIRSNKWTAFGSATSDGCQALFALFSAKDDRYNTASWRNLQFIRSNITHGLLGYGPQYAEVFDTPPCIYPSFAKAKNLALAWTLESGGEKSLPPLPADKAGWVKLFPTLDVAEMRSAHFMGTITAYRYKDVAGGAHSKYMYRPDGGALSHLWLKGAGFLQASSVTVYSRPEPMHFPEAPGIQSLTPRITFEDSTGYFTNLFDFDSHIQIMDSSNRQQDVQVSGELKDSDQLAGGIGYVMDYRLTDSSLEKAVQLTWHDSRTPVTIVEPFIWYSDRSFERVDDHTVLIHAGGQVVRFSVTGGKATLIAGRNASRYWAPYPSFKAYPIELVIKPAPDAYKEEVRYRIELLPGAEKNGQ